jgi:hypothetical protein
MRQGSRANDGAVGDANAMVDFVPLFGAAQNGDGIFNGWFADVNGLEPAFEGWVFLDALAILVESGGPDAAQFPRASAVFNILEAFIAPSASPVPTKVWSSSIKRMICPLASVTSFKTALRRS